MRIIAITAQKGGSGKTTNALNIGTGLSYLGKKVLLIDMDPQASLTDGLGVIPEECKRSVADVLLRKLTIPDVAVKINRNLDLVPASDELTGLEISLADHKDRNIRLSAALDRVKAQYDYIIIDCGLKHELLTVNALAAADYCIIPVQAHFLASEGIPDVLEMVRNVQNRFNPDLKIAGILLTMYQSRPQLCQSVRSSVGEIYGDSIHVFDRPIEQTIKVAECPAAGMSILDYAPKNPAADSYRSLAQEVLRLG